MTLSINKLESFKSDVGEYILGLDLGANSIGWAVVPCQPNHANEHEPLAIDVERAGVNIFPAGVDKLGMGEKEASRAVNRRERRQSRRQYARKSKRKDRLFNALISTGLLSKGTPRNIFATPLCPYEVRKRALDEEVTLEELSRALYHINSRRGFKSSAKDRAADDTNTIHEGMKEKVDGVDVITKPGINDIAEAINTGEVRTIGEYLENLDGTDGLSERKRDRYTLRQHYIDEVDAIWESQQRFHNGKLSDDNLDEIKSIIFHQRNLRSQKNSRRKCSITYKKTVAAKSHPLFQEYRLRALINNLTVKLVGSYGQAVDLSAEDREAIFQHLATKEKIKLGGGNGWLQRVLGYPKGTQLITNFDKKTVKCLTTQYRINSAAEVKDENGKKDKKKTDASQENAENHLMEIYHDLLYGTSREWMKKRAMEKYGFDEGPAEKLAKTGLEDFYGSYSIAAIKELLPYLKQGHGEHHARRLAYENGAFDKWQKYKPSEGEIGKFVEEVEKINNPVVNAAMQTLKKVYNELVYLYGSPKIIKIEFAREITQSKDGRAKTGKKINDNEKRNESARDTLKEHKVPVAQRWQIEKIKLWEDQNKSCIYSGQKISITDLISGPVDVDHILPYSKTFDNSYMNKVVCLRSENAKKNNLLPYDAYANTDPDKYAAIMQRAYECFHPDGKNKAKELFAKFRRFERRDLKDEDEFVSQQLNDTRYINTEARKMLDKVCEDVRTSKGSTTNFLKYSWELLGLLEEHHYQDPSRTQKKDRLDNRHHALDAIIIALTTRSHVKYVADTLQDEEDYKLIHGVYQKNRYSLRKEIDSPIEGISKFEFRNLVGRVLDRILVVHKPERKLRGGFHQDTFYGWRKDGKGDRVREGKYALLHVRKPINSLTMKQIGKTDDAPTQIADPKVRESLLKAIRRAGYDPEYINDKDLQAILSRPVMHSFPRSKRDLPIKAVKLITKKANPLKIADYDKFVLTDNNFCMAYYKNIETGKINAESINMFNACKKFPGKIVSEELKKGAANDEEFLLYLQNRDTILGGGFPDGFDAEDHTTYDMISKDISRVMTWAGTSKQLWHLGNIYSLDKKAEEESVVNENNKIEYKEKSITLTKSFKPGSYSPNTKKLRLSHTGLIEDWF